MHTLAEGRVSGCSLWCPLLVSCWICYKSSCGPSYCRLFFCSRIAGTASLQREGMENLTNVDTERQACNRRAGGMFSSCSLYLHHRAWSSRTISLEPTHRHCPLSACCSEWPNHCPCSSCTYKTAPHPRLRAVSSTNRKDMHKISEKSWESQHHFRQKAAV